jgi:hypothetical protein
MADAKTPQAIDLRSYYPKLARTITWDDGRVFHIREIMDLSEAEFAAGVEDEGRFGEMDTIERGVAEKRHLKLRLVSPLPPRVHASNGREALIVDGDGTLDLVTGDMVIITEGLYVQRNVVAVVQTDGRGATMERPWRFDVEGGRIYRSIRDADFTDLTREQFWAAATTVRTMPKEEGDEEAVPQQAAAQST